MGAEFPAEIGRDTRLTPDNHDTAEALLQCPDPLRNCGCGDTQSLSGALEASFTNDGGNGGKGRIVEHD